MRFKVCVFGLALVVWAVAGAQESNVPIQEAASGGAVAGLPDQHSTHTLGGIVETRSGGPCPSVERMSLRRPGPELTPTEVGAALFLNNIIALDDVRQSVEADVFLILRWQDPRLAGGGRDRGSVPCSLPRDKLWFPEWQADRLLGASSFYDDTTLIDPDGVITWVRRSLLRVSTPLHLEEFPFDSHSLAMSFAPLIHGTGEVVFRVLEDLNGRAEVLQISGWTIGEVSGRVRELHAPRRGMDISVFEFQFEARRQWQYFVFKLIIPLTLIVLMAGAVLVIPPAAFPSRISLGVTSMLTLIAYQFALANMLPRISYLTRADHFILGSSILVFLSLAHAVVSSYLVKADRESLVLRIDRIGWVCFPVAFAGILTGAFLL